MRYTIAAMLSVLFAGSTMAEPNYETPRYTAIVQNGAMEIRDYAPMIVAEVTVPAESVREAANRGFMPLADYIFGNNAPRQDIAMTAPVTAQKRTEIAMTAPVTTSSTGAGEYTVQFIMPSEWTMDTLPVPNNSRVRLTEQPAQTLATYRYVGSDSPAIRRSAEDALAAFIEAEGYTIVGSTIWAGYSGPRTPRRQRQYEIMLPVAR